MLEPQTYFLDWFLHLIDELVLSLNGVLVFKIQETLTWRPELNPATNLRFIRVELHTSGFLFYKQRLL